MKAIMAKALVVCLMVNLCVTHVDAAQKPKLSTKSVSLTVGKTKTLKVKNTKKKARWSIKSGKKYIKLKAKKKASVKLVGVKKGTAKVQCKIGKKILVCKVKVISKTILCSTEIPIPSVAPTGGAQTMTPTQKPTPTESPKITETSPPKNVSDVEALTKLIAEQKECGAKVKEDLSSTTYTWNESGRLVGINWQDCELSGDITFSGLPTLKELDCSFNSLTVLDVSGNAELHTLYLQNNDVKEINLSQNTQLQTLDCGDNLLETLDVSGLTNLERLWCSNCALTSISLKRCVALKNLHCDENSLTSVDISDCNELEEVSASNNQMTQLDVSGKAKLKKLYCRCNQLTELDVSDNVLLMDLDCGDNQLSELDVSANIVLSDLLCYDNCISTLDLRQNPSLYDLYCSRNQLTEVLLAPNDCLYRFHCADNRIEVLDVSMCKWLYELDASNNEMDTLIVSLEQNLGAFQVGEVQVVLPTGELLTTQLGVG